MITVSDYIVKRLVEHGVKDVFMIPGGGAMFLNNSIGSCEEIRYICNQHEQASAMAAEGYARIGNKLGVVCVTSGPGGTNTLTGVIGQWVDSVPVLYISGQIKFETSIESCREIGLRQLGDQEINIIDIVKPVTKFATMVNNPLEIKKQLDKAIHIAQTGRPGPVWIDVPLNVQSSLIDENELFEYGDDEVLINESEIEIKIEEIFQLLKKAKRPVFLAGSGIKISGAKKEFLKLIDILGIPVISTFNGIDLIETDNHNFVGRIGTMGDRAGNFALQNSDLLLSVGSRNNMRQVSYNWSSYAREAKKVIVDIDLAELKKSTVIPDVAVHSDAKFFIEKLLEKIDNKKLADFSSWLNWCIERKDKYPVVLEEYKKLAQNINPYYFVQKLTEKLEEGATVVTGNGTACVAYFQAGIVKKNQRVLWNSGCASMGYDLPAAIGACFAKNKSPIVCLTGDGSIQMNIQELETIIYHNLPIKIFLFNNGGYISMKQTQDTYFNGKYTAANTNSGVGFPNFIKVAQAYGFKTETIDKHINMESKIESVLNCEGPILCEVKLLDNYIFSPKLSSDRKPDGKLVSKPLEDMYPFLDRDEFENNMIIEPWNEE